MHVARAFAAIDWARVDGRPFDIVHDHCGFSAFAIADRLTTQLVHTLPTRRQRTVALRNPAATNRHSDRTPTATP